MTPDKENMYHHHAMYGQQMPHFAPPYPQPQQVLGKRGPDADLLSSASHDRTVKRLRPEDEESAYVPEPDELPVLTDDGGKPPFSYAQLIGMAILRAPNRRLTLSQIYKWISDSFQWYREAEPGWMNSIRHNLSLNKAFVKKERPKDDPGKGNYWAIEEGMEKQFLKDKSNTRRPTNPDATYMQQMTSEPARPMAPIPMMETFALPAKTSRTVDSSRFPGENESTSSDATLPDENKDEDVMMPPPSRIMPSSPPRGNFDSSPPVHLPHDGSTPVSASFRHARKPASGTFKDSGFFSSIESSVGRSHNKHIENDREDVRSSGLRGSGRAEEELARIRGSSYDPSPTRAKSAMGMRQYTELAPPSSPTRTIETTIGFPPLTPAVKLNPSVRPQSPSTVSPNTHLRRHRETIRELVGTPAQNLPHYSLEEMQWTPAFSLQHQDPDYSQTPGFEPGSASTPSSASFSNTYGLLWNDDMSCGGGNIGSGVPSPSISNVRRSSAEQAQEASADNYDVFFARGSPLKANIKRPLIQRPASTGPLSTSASSTSSSAEKTTMPPPPARGSLLGSPFRGLRGGAGFGHIRSISRGSKDFGASFVNSPLRKEMAPGSDGPEEGAMPATPVRKSGLSSGITVDSPGDSLSIWDAYLAGLEDDEDVPGVKGAEAAGGAGAGIPSWMEESKDVEGLDLAKGFSAIGASVAVGGAANVQAQQVPALAMMAPPMQPSQSVAGVAGAAALRRPSFMRRSTTQM